MAGIRMKPALYQLRLILTQGVRATRSTGCAYCSTTHQTPNDGGTNPPGPVPPVDRTIKLQKEVKDLTELCRRALADSDSVRRRTQKFVQDAKLFGIQSFCRDLVEVADILEKAVNDAEQKGKKEESEILRAIEEKLSKIFTKHGLQKMDAVGDHYDPYEHQIVKHVAAEGITPGCVAFIKQDGYRLHGRTVRHAKVGIAMETQKSHS